MRSRPSTTQSTTTRRVSFLRLQETRRVFCRPTIFPRPATTPRTRHVSSCAPRVVRASAVERFGSPEGSRDPRVLGRRVCSRNPASFKRDAHAPWRRRTGPPWGRPASAPPRRPRHADDRRALPNRRRVRSRLPVRTRVRLGLEPRRVRGRRLRRARGRSRPRSAHVGGSRLRAPAVRRVARPGGRPLTRARGLRARHRRVRRRVAARARARGARRRGSSGRGAAGTRPAPSVRAPGERGSSAAGSRQRGYGTGAGASDGSGRERSPRSPRLSGMSPAGLRGDGTPAGHVSTPWADRSSRREQRRAADRAARRVRRVGRRRGR